MNLTVAPVLQTISSLSPLLVLRHVQWTLHHLQLRATPLNRANRHDSSKVSSSLHRYVYRSRWTAVARALNTHRARSVSAAKYNQQPSGIPQSNSFSRTGIAVYRLCARPSCSPCGVLHCWGADPHVPCIDILPFNRHVFIRWWARDQWSRSSL